MSDDSGQDPNAWMLSFSDTLTNLLCFFVLLLTMSSMDSKVLTKTFGFFNGAAGPLQFASAVDAPSRRRVQQPAVSNALSEQVVDAMRRRLKGGEQTLRAAAASLVAFSTDPSLVVVAQDGAGLSINVASQHMFDEAGALSAEGAELLDVITGLMRASDLQLELVAWARQDPEPPPLWKDQPDSWDRAAMRGEVVLRYLARDRRVLDRIVLGTRGDGRQVGDDLRGDPDRVSLRLNTQQETKP